MSTLSLLRCILLPGRKLRRRFSSSDESLGGEEITIVSNHIGEEPRRESSTEDESNTTSTGSAKDLELGSMDSKSAVSEASSAEEAITLIDEQELADEQPCCSTQQEQVNLEMERMVTIDCSQQTAVRNKLYFRDGKRYIDYVLVYYKYKDATSDNPNAILERRRRSKRWAFEEKLVQQGLQLEMEVGKNEAGQQRCYVKIHATWEFVARQAELLAIKVPFAKTDIPENRLVGWLEVCWEWLTRKFRLDEYKIEHGEYFCEEFDANRAHHFMKLDRELVFTVAQRGRMVYDALDRTCYNSKTDSSRMGISRLIESGTYAAAYPLHQGSAKGFTKEMYTDRQLLYETWARPGRWYKQQPLDIVRNYFGEKLGIYFAWLGFYTAALIPAASIGIMAVLWGVRNVADGVGFDQEICDESKAGNFTMCPLCDICPFWKLSNSCTYSLITHAMDTTGTVFFSMFMSIWATCFLEGWKRKLAEISFKWGLYESEIEHERVRPEFESQVKTKRQNPVTHAEEPYLTRKTRCMRWMASFATVLFFLCLVMAFVVGVIIYRMIVHHIMAVNPVTQEYASIITSMTAAILNLFCILLLSRLYQGLAFKLTKMELPRTDSEFEDSYTVKVFLFQFINYYSSLFYIAFIKGKFSRMRGISQKIFEKYSMESCDPSGCMVELVIQLAIIMVGKQFLNNFMEIIFPLVQNSWRRHKEKIKEASVRRKTIMERLKEERAAQWEKDFKLNPEPKEMLLNEYLEMVIQYGFITLFVAAFPLAPFFALLNNIGEIRLDAYKFVAVFRRPTPRKSRDLGVWMGILNVLSKMAVVTNACVIAFTSDFIPRLLYAVKSGGLTGYIDWQLSYFNASEYENIDKLNEDFGQDVSICRYRGLRLPPCGAQMINYSRWKKPGRAECGPGSRRSIEWWQEVAFKMTFMLAFIVVVFAVKKLVSYLVPDVPASVKTKIQREIYLSKQAEERFQKLQDKTAYLIESADKMKGTID